MSSAGSPRNSSPFWFSSTSKLALDGADGGLRHIAVGRREFLRVLGDELQQRAQILEVDQQQALLVGDAERDVEHAFLRVVEIEQAREQQRPHLGDRRPHPVALLAEQVPEHHRKAVRHVIDADFLGALDEGLLAGAGGSDAREVALDVGCEDRDARVGEAFGQHLQRDRLAGARRAGDEAVPVGEPQIESFRLGAFADKDLAVFEHRWSPVCLGATLRKGGERILLALSLDFGGPRRRTIV